MLQINCKFQVSKTRMYWQECKSSIQGNEFSRYHSAFLIISDFWRNSAAVLFFKNVVLSVWVNLTTFHLPILANSSCARSNGTRVLVCAICKLVERVSDILRQSTGIGMVPPLVYL